MVEENKYQYLSNEKLKTPNQKFGYEKFGNSSTQESSLSHSSNKKSPIFEYSAKGKPYSNPGPQPLNNNPFMNSNPLYGVYAQMYQQMLMQQNSSNPSQNVPINMPQMPPILPPNQFQSNPAKMSTESSQNMPQTQTNVPMFQTFYSVPKMGN